MRLSAGSTLALAAIHLMMTAGPVHAQCVEGCVAIHTLIGEAPGDQFGWEARVLGDVDGDGLDDFIVSAPTNDAGGADAGRVYVFSGATGTELFRITGTAAGGQFGFTSNGVGDVSGDGIPDFVVGAPVATGRGRVTVHSGVDGSVMRTLLGEQNGDVFGYRAVGGGDLNGDGVPDLLISAARRDATGVDAGRAYVYSGADGTLLCFVDGEDGGDNLGSSLAFTGDLNGDGRSEFIVGADNAGPATTGRAYLYSYDGSTCTLLHTFSPGTPAFAYGQFFADGGEDVDADGIPDFYVADFNVNRAYVYSGANYQLLRTLIGNNNGGFGIGEIMPDIDNDGRADLILAAWISNAGGTQAGRVFVYSGRTGAVLQTMTHNIAGATFGFDAAGIGDLNADGRSDYLISAAWDAGQRGTVYVIAGDVEPFLDTDLDFNGCVDLVDLSLLLADFGCANGACAADIDENGAVDLSDLSTVLGQFGMCRP
ncbi:MAG: hypothetical protein AMXMBFR47_38880 [Planctomycetota bacterium]